MFVSLLAFFLGGGLLIFELIGLAGTTTVNTYSRVTVTDVAMHTESTIIRNELRRDLKRDILVSEKSR